MIKCWIKIYYKFIRPPKQQCVNFIVISIYNVFMRISTLYLSSRSTLLLLWDVASCHAEGGFQLALRCYVTLRAYDGLCLLQSIVDYVPVWLVYSVLCRVFGSITDPAQHRIHYGSNRLKRGGKHYETLYCVHRVHWRCFVLF